ncbi:MAG: hypothetical protein DMG21_00775 [Acidobacteria bacterium]|nr:MAG: hypothetical protein DMG21_00775 [Acidobacteriota bacterium]
MRFDRTRPPGPRGRAGHEESAMVNRKLRKPAPPEQTNAENFYYIKQMQARTPMVVILNTGDEIRGLIEWYDKNCIKVHRAHEPNLLIMKSAVRLMYKQNENKNNGEDLSDRDPGNE